MSRRIALARLGALVVVAGCVDIATGPNGIDAIRLDTRAHAIIEGDTLRDSTGAVVRIRATAFDKDGNPVSGAGFSFLALPTRSFTDTTTHPPAVVVDSTGLVRAITPRVADLARVAIQSGGKLQLVDTLRIVTRPTLLTRVTPLDTARLARLTFQCTDAYTERAQAILSGPIAGVTDSTYIGNVIPLTTKLTGDSSGTAVPVPGYWVQYTIVSPKSDSIPTVTLPSGAKRRAIEITNDPTGDRPTAFDTTNNVGNSIAGLRIFGRALGESAFKNAVIPVKVIAQARRSPTDTLKSVEFTLRLQRVVSLTDPSQTACPAP